MTATITYTDGRTLPHGLGKCRGGMIVAAFIAPLAVTGAAVRPSEIAFGAHWDVDHMKWTSWDAGSAFGHGTYYEGSLTPYKDASMTLSVVRTHSGRKYFAQIRIVKSGRSTVYLHYYPHGGRVWQVGKAGA